MVVKNCTGYVQLTMWTGETWCFGIANLRKRAADVCTLQFQTEIASRDILDGVVAQAAQRAMWFDESSVRSHQRWSIPARWPRRRDMEEACEPDVHQQAKRTVNNWRGRLTAKAKEKLKSCKGHSSKTRCRTFFKSRVYCRPCIVEKLQWPHPCLKGACGES